MSTRKVKLTELKETFVVRIQLSRDHVEHLRSLIETGVELDPLLVSSDDMELIDGRHRLEAYKEMGRTDVLCRFKRYESTGDKIVAALHANVGGSLPPTPADINHTMQLMIASGETRASIITKVSQIVGFPKKLVQKHLDRVQSDMHKAQLNKAIHAVAHKGHTLSQAAAEFGVRLETLQRNVAGKGEPSVTDAQQLKSHLSVQYTKLTKICGLNLSRLIRGLKDGVMLPEDAVEVISHLKKITGRFNRYHDEWISRFEKHLGATEEAQKVAVKKARKAGVSQGQKTLARMGL